MLVGITEICTWWRTKEDPANTSRSLAGDKSNSYCNQLASFRFSSYPYHECKRFTDGESKMKMSYWIQGSTKVFPYIFFSKGVSGRPGFPGPASGPMSRSTPPLNHSGWMSRPGGGGWPAEPPMSRGMNDVFVTDNGFRHPSGPRFDDFSGGGVPNDRVGFGSR